MKKTIKLICLDLDGTLIARDPEGKGYIPEENITSIQKAVSHGIKVCLATGRGRAGSLRVAKEVGIEDQYVISYNGALIATQKEILHETYLSGEPLQQVLKIIRENNVYAQLYHNGNMYVAKRTETTQWHESHYNVTITEIGDELYQMTSTAKILMTTFDPVEKKKWVKLFDGIEGVNVVESTPHFLEIMNINATKGLAVKKLAEILGIELEEVMAIGDELNDISMLDVAGYPVVMGQAKDELKKGRLVTETCANAGVGKAIQKYCFGN